MPKLESNTSANANSAEMFSFRLLLGCLSALGGIALLHQQIELPANPIAQLMASVLVLLLCVVMRSWSAPRWRLALLLLGLALLGYAGTAWRAQHRLNQALPQELEGRELIVTGLVASLPQAAQGIGGAQGWRFQFDVQAVHDMPPVNERQVPAHIQMAWFANNKPIDRPIEWRVGDLWRLKVKLKRVHGLANPNGFDQELNLFEQNIGATGIVREAQQLVQAQTAFPLDQRRQALRDTIHAYEPNASVAGLLIALTLGDQGSIPAADWAIYRATGVAHLMSISGLHITMFAWGIGLLVRALWRRSRYLMRLAPTPVAARCFGVAAALAYAIFAGWGIPAQRTVMMLLLVALLTGSARRWPWPMILLFTATVVCAWDPWAMLQAGFWLSFLAVALLTASSTVHEGELQRHSVNGWIRWRRELRNQTVATIGLAPLTLLCFQQISLVGFVANVVAIPLVTLIAVPLALLGMIFPILWSVDAPLLQLLHAGLSLASQLPSGLWFVPVAPLWAQLAGLLASLVIIMPLPWRVRALGIPLLLPMLWPPLIHPVSGEFELHALDVGQGTAVTVRTAQHLLVFDTGPSYGFDNDAGQRVMLPYLRSQGLPPIDVLMLSHRDADHVGGAKAVLRDWPVRTVLSSLEQDHALLNQRVHEPCVAGQRWEWDGVHFEVLHPALAATERASKPNRVSCVLRVQARSGASALLTGDIEKEQEAWLVQNAPQKLKATLLLAPHHGSKTSSSAEFLDTVSPKLAVFQAGYRNRFGHPTDGVLKRYQERGIRLVKSADCGAWAWDGKIMSCERERRRRYWSFKGHADLGSGELTHHSAVDMPVETTVEPD